MELFKLSVPVWGAGNMVTLTLLQQKAITAAQANKHSTKVIQMLALCSCFKQIRHVENELFAFTLISPGKIKLCQS